MVRMHQQRLRSQHDCHNTMLEAATFLTGASAPIFALDKGSRVVLWNDEMQRITSLTRADVTGMSVSMLVPAAEATRLEKLTKKLLSGSAELGETRIYTYVYISMGHL